MLTILIYCKEIIAIQNKNPTPQGKGLNNEKYKVKGVGRPGYIYLKPDSYTPTPPGEEIKLKRHK